MEGCREAYDGVDLVCRGMNIIREWYRRPLSSTVRSGGCVEGCGGMGGVRRA